MTWIVSDVDAAAVHNNKDASSGTSNDDGSYYGYNGGGFVDYGGIHESGNACRQKQGDHYAATTASYFPPSGTWNIYCDNLDGSSAPKSASVSVLESTCLKPAPSYTYRWSVWSDTTHECGVGTRYETESCSARSGCNCMWGTKRALKPAETRTKYTTCNIRVDPVAYWVQRAESSTEWSTQCRSHFGGEWFFTGKLVNGKRSYRKDTQEGTVHMFADCVSPGDSRQIWVATDQDPDGLGSHALKDDIEFCTSNQFAYSNGGSSDSVVPPLTSKWHRVICTDNSMDTAHLNRNIEGDRNNAVDMDVKISQSTCTLPAPSYVYAFANWQTADPSADLSPLVRVESESCYATDPSGTSDAKTCGCNPSSRQVPRTEIRSCCNLMLTTTRTCAPPIAGEWQFLATANQRKHYLRDLTGDMNMHSMIEADKALLGECRDIRSRASEGKYVIVQNVASAGSLHAEHGCNVVAVQIDGAEWEVKCNGEWKVETVVVGESFCSPPPQFTVTNTSLGACSDGKQEINEVETCNAAEGCDCQFTSRRALQSFAFGCGADIPGENTGDGDRAESNADIPDDDDAAVDTNGAGTGTSRAGKSAAIATVVLLLLLCLVGWVVVNKRKRGNANAEQGLFSSCLPSTSRQLLMRELCSKTRERAEQTFLLKYSRRLFSEVQSADEYSTLVGNLGIAKKRLQLSQELGEGNYGKVYAAELGETSMPVAVKISTPPANGEYDATIDEALLTEALVLFALRHENIVGLIGICFETLPFMMVTELMPNGDLKTFLRHYQTLLPQATPQNGATIPSKTDSAVHRPLTLLDAIIIIEKIARALAHLESVQVIHRDVAARNVLVGRIPTEVKLGDLGAARSVFREADQEYTASTEHMPAKWMALESLQSATFTSKSDVWSFGVLCWEVTHLGAKPYGEIGMEDIIIDLRKGNRLPEAAASPPGLYRQMMLCWSSDPKRRPRFGNLVHYVGAIRGALAVSASGSVLLGTSMPNPAGSAAAPSSFSPYSSCAPLNSAAAADDGYYQDVYERVVTNAVEVPTDPKASPLGNLSATPLTHFFAVVKAAEKHPAFSIGLQEEAAKALVFAKNMLKRGTTLGCSIDQIAAIHLYTQASPFYKALNAALGGWGRGSGGRPSVVYFMKYIKLAQTALDLLPRIESICYRGLKNVTATSVLDGRTIGDTMTWWAFTSTTGTSDVLRDPDFLGVGEEHGERVVFKLLVKNGLRIKQFSDLGDSVDDYLIPFGVETQNEDEILLRPGTTFVIESVTKYDGGITEIGMHEVEAHADSTDSAGGAVSRSGCAANSLSPKGAQPSPQAEGSDYYKFSDLPDALNSNNEYFKFADVPATLGAKSLPDNPGSEWQAAEGMRERTATVWRERDVLAVAGLSDASSTATDPNSNGNAADYHMASATVLLPAEQPVQEEAAYQMASATPIAAEETHGMSISTRHAPGTSRERLNTNWSQVPATSSNIQRSNRKPSLYLDQPGTAEDETRL